MNKANLAAALGLIILGNGCKTTSPRSTLSSPDGRPLSPYADAEFFRINSPANQSILWTRMDTPSSESHLENADKNIDRKAFSELWDRLKFVRLTTADVRSGAEHLSYKVRLHIREILPDASPEVRQAAVWKASKVSRQNSSEIERSCKSQTFDATKPSARTAHISFRLLTLDQPDLSRNFLALAYLGYFDGTAFSHHRDYTGLVSLGVGKDSDSFILYPDLLYTPPQAIHSIGTPIARETRTESGRIIGRNPERDLYDSGAVSPATKYGALSGITTNPSQHEGGRQVLGPRVAVTTYQSAAQEIEDKFGQNQNFPIPFGLPVDHQAGSNLLQDIAHSLFTFGKNATYVVDCVEIAAPEITAWSLPGGRSIYLY
jgi:hypothetical protein